MSPAIHFYDGRVIGTPSLGQLVSFDSLLCGNTEQHHYSAEIALRADVAFFPQAVEQLECFDQDLGAGISEYDWSRQAQCLLARPATLHVGVGNTSSFDNYVRYGLYRSLCTLPNTYAQSGTHFLDLLSVCRAIELLRPDTMPMALPSTWGESHRREKVHREFACDSMAASVSALAKAICMTSPSLLSHAVAYSAPEKISKLCGLVDGQVESMAAMPPVFMCHEHLHTEGRWGIFMAVGTDPHYPNVIYMVDLRVDLTELIADAGASVGRFIRSDAKQVDRPIHRINLNRVPFVSPIGVIDKGTARRLDVDLAKVRNNAALVARQHDISLSLMEISGASDATLRGDPDFQIFGSEYLETDRNLLDRLHRTDLTEWRSLLETAHDSRIVSLGDRLIRRLEPALSSEAEALEWAAHCASRLAGSYDESQLAVIADYCKRVLSLSLAPKGMRAAASHWLKTTENRNEPSHNL